MSLKKDKEKVFGGQWSEEQLKEFSQVTSHDGTDVDFLALKKAYQHMTVDAFSAFVAVLKQAGKNINAQNLEGQNFLQYIQQHTQSQEYEQALKEHLEN